MNMDKAQNIWAEKGPGSSPGRDARNSGGLSSAPRVQNVNGPKAEKLWDIQQSASQKPEKEEQDSMVRKPLPPASLKPSWGDTQT